MIDLANLTPAPWRPRPLPHDDWGCLRGPDDMPVADFCRARAHRWCEENRHLEFSSPELQKGPPGVVADLGFCAMARNAFAIMMERGWGVVNRWRAESGRHFCALEAAGWFRDPFTALVEADRWMKENVEAKGGIP